MLKKETKPIFAEREMTVFATDVIFTADFSCLSVSQLPCVHREKCRMQSHGKTQTSCMISPVCVCVCAFMGYVISFAVSEMPCVH